MSEKGTRHPEFSRLARALDAAKLKGGRLERARQFFQWSLTSKVVLEAPAAIEKEIDGCVEQLRKRGLA